jgi:hypothetical protein
MITLKHDHGALIEVPIFEKHKRGKNWMAVISINPTKPGGLGRKFMNRAHGEYKYSIEGLKKGNAIEFGADYYSSKLNRTPKRFYGVIVEITEKELIIEEMKTGRKAIEYSESNSGSVK